MRLFALFENAPLTDAAVKALRRQALLGDDFRMLKGAGEPVHRAEPALVAQTGGISAGVAAGPDAGRAGPDAATDELVAQGLSPGEAQFFAGVMGRGGQTLVWEPRPSGANPVELLREAGAIHVVAVQSA